MGTHDAWKGFLKGFCWGEGGPVPEYLQIDGREGQHKNPVVSPSIKIVWVSLGA